MGVLLTLISASWVLAASSVIPEDAPLTMEDAVRLAVARHQDVGKARAAADALKGKIREVRAQALPEINLVSNVTRWRDPSLLNSSGVDRFPADFRDALAPSAVNVFDYSLTVKQPLFTQGKVG